MTVERTAPQSDVGSSGSRPVGNIETSLHEPSASGRRASGRHRRPKQPDVRSGPATATNRWMRHSLLRNSVFLVMTTASTSLLGYMFWAIVARASTAESVGLASAAISAFSLVAYAGSLGAGGLAIQILPNLEGTAWGEFLWRILAWTSLVSASLSIGTALLLPEVSHTFDALRGGLFAPFVIGAVFTCASGIVDGALVSLRRSDKQLARNTLFGVAKILLLAVPWFLRGDVSATALMWIWSAALFVSVVAGMAALVPVDRRSPIWRSSYSASAFFGHYRLLFGNLLSGLGGLLPMYIFPVLVAGSLGSAENAYFFFVWSISGVFYMISAAIAQAMFAEAVNTDRVRSHLRSATKACVAVLLPLAVLGFTVGPTILHIFGAKYAVHGAGLLRINILAAFPDAVTNLYVAVAMAHRRVLAAAALNIGMAIIATVGSAMTLPSLGINAVGWCWLIAQSAGAIAVFVLVAAWRQGQGVAETVHSPTVS